MGNSMRLAEIAGFDIEKLQFESLRAEAKETDRVRLQKKARSDLLPGMAPVDLARVLRSVR